MEGKKTIERIRLGDIIKNHFDELILITKIDKNLVYGIYIEYKRLIRCIIPRVMLDRYEKVENIFDRRKNNED